MKKIFFTFLLSQKPKRICLRSSSPLFYFYENMIIWDHKFKTVPMKLKLKKLTKKSERVFKESEVLVVLENMDDNMKLLAEGQAQINKELQDFQESVNDNFKVVMEYLYRIEGETLDVKRRLENIEAGKADKEEYFSLEKRVEDLEQRMERVGILLKVRKT